MCRQEATGSKIGDGLCKKGHRTIRRNTECSHSANAVIQTEITVSLPRRPGGVLRRFAFPPSNVARDVCSIRLGFNGMLSGAFEGTDGGTRVLAPEVVSCSWLDAPRFLHEFNRQS